MDSRLQPLIRKARDSEIEQVRALLAAAYRQYEKLFPPANWTRYFADIQDLEGRAAVSELIVAQRADSIVGCVSFYPPGSKMSYPSESFSEHWPTQWAAIRLLAVHPSARGSGLGRALTRACIDRARAQGAPALGLHTTKEMDVARRMYRGMGFERAPSYDFHPGPTVTVEAYELML
jgi:ribosomal protein S18 acetylase RimI-like enzyme